MLYQVTYAILSYYLYLDHWSTLHPAPRSSDRSRIPSDVWDGQMLKGFFSEHPENTVSLAFSFMF